MVLAMAIYALNVRIINRRSGRARPPPPPKRKRLKTGSPPPRHL
tara:strand:+ start:108 stop:239 length:132 start_codon:yes stop_codon:yes gene_type:complete